jgi:hypothetical protein
MKSTRAGITENPNRYRGNLRGCIRAPTCRELSCQGGADGCALRWYGKGVFDSAKEH